MSIPIIFLLIVLALNNTNTKEKQFIEKLEKEMIEVSTKPLKRKRVRSRPKNLKKSESKIKKKSSILKKDNLFKAYSDYQDLEGQVTPWRVDSL